MHEVASREPRVMSNRFVPHRSCCRCGNVVRTQVNAVGSGGQRNVGAGVDEKTSSQFPVLSSQSLR